MFCSKKILIILIIFCSTFISFLEGSLIPNSENKPIHEAFVTKFSEPIEPILIPYQPPPPLDLPIPRQPSLDVIWIPGYWAWVNTNHDFVWVCGIWRKPPPNKYWISGYWINQDNGWAWARGYWNSSSSEKLPLINKAPPFSIDDQIPDQPGNDYFWVPGYWNIKTSNDYEWLSGKWAPLNKHWILTPATYIWRPTGYIFVPLFWDYSLEFRGNAYTCEGNGPLVLMTPQIIIQNLFFYYPDYISLFHHSYYFYPDWWLDSKYLPPWWNWKGWWSFCWGDMWGLWWWWGHPNFLSPFWNTKDLSLQIPPPSLVLIDAFKKMSKPVFPYLPSIQVLLPNGSPEITNVPKPNILNKIVPSSEVKLPNLPMTH